MRVKQPSFVSNNDAVRRLRGVQYTTTSSPRAYNPLPIINYYDIPMCIFVAYPSSIVIIYMGIVDNVIVNILFIRITMINRYS